MFVYRILDFNVRKIVIMILFYAKSWRKSKSLSVSLLPRNGGEEEEEVLHSCSYIHSVCNCDPRPHNCLCNIHPEVNQEEENQRYFLLLSHFFS